MFRSASPPRVSWALKKMALLTSVNTLLRMILNRAVVMVTRPSGAQADFQSLAHIDLIDRIGSNVVGMQIVDHAAVFRVAQKGEAVRRGLRNDRCEDAGNVGQIGRGPLIENVLLLELKAGQQGV